MRIENIDGVIVREIATHGDDRGFFREVLRVNEDFQLAHVGQISHSLVNTGVLKAWHYHQVQSQWNYVACGEVLVALFDNRREAKTFGKVLELRFGEKFPPRAYFFPPGVLHGYCCLKGPMHIIYMTSGVYDLSEEGRWPKDSLGSAYEWKTAIQEAE